MLWLTVCLIVKSDEFIGSKCQIKLTACCYCSFYKYYTDVQQSILYLTIRNRFFPPNFFFFYLHSWLFFHGKSIFYLFILLMLCLHTMCIHGNILRYCPPPTHTMDVVNICYVCSLSKSALIIKMGDLLECWKLRSEKYAKYLLKN